MERIRSHTRHIGGMRKGLPKSISTSALLTVSLLTGCGRGGQGALRQPDGMHPSPTASQQETADHVFGRPGQPPSPTANAECVGGQFTPTVATDRTHYAEGATVSITATAENISQLPCWMPTNNCDPHADPSHPFESAINLSGPNYSIERQSGQSIWFDPHPHGVTSPCTVAERMLQPGQSISHEWQWSQQVNCNNRDSAGLNCAPSGQAGPGSYYVTLRWDGALLGNAFYID